MVWCLIICWFSNLFIVLYVVLGMFLVVIVLRIGEIDILFLDFCCIYNFVSLWICFVGCVILGLIDVIVVIFLELK